MSQNFKLLNFIFFIDFFSLLNYFSLNFLIENKFLIVTSLGTISICFLLIKINSLNNFNYNSFLQDFLKQQDKTAEQLIADKILPLNQTTKLINQYFSIFETKIWKEAMQNLFNKEVLTNLEKTNKFSKLSPKAQKIEFDKFKELKELELFQEIGFNLEATLALRDYNLLKISQLQSLTFENGVLNQSTENVLFLFNAISL